MTTITPAEFAAEVESDSRTVRKFLRAITPKDEQPGKGARWALAGNKRDVQKLKKQFSEWSEKQAEEKAAREAGQVESEPEPVESELELDD